MDHAVFGVKILFGEGMIRDFIKTDRYDPIIKRAIGCHSLYRLPEVLEGKELLHCRLIRDADKLDNFRVKDMEGTQAIFGLSEEEVGKEAVSPNILQAFQEERTILKAERTTHMDCWISYLAFLYDLNFASSYRFIWEQDYFNRNIDKIPYSNEETKKVMESIRSMGNSYLEKKISANDVFRLKNPED